MIGSDNKLLAAASGFEVDNTYKLNAVDFNSLSLRGTTYPSIDLNLAANHGNLVPADGGGSIYEARNRTIEKYTTYSNYYYKAATSGVVERKLQDGGIEGSGYLKAGGDRLYTTDGSSIKQYVLSTAYDPSSYTKTTLTVSGTGYSGVSSVWFKPDGTRMYVLFRSSQLVGEWTLSTAWDISTASKTSNELDYSSDTTQTGSYNIWMKPNGGTLYLSTHSHVANSISIFEYDLSTAFDLSSISTSYDRLNSFSDWFYWSAAMNGSGTEFYTSYYYGGQIRKYTLSTAYDLSTASYSSTATPGTISSDQYGFISWSPDGNALLKTLALWYDDALIMKTPTSFDVSSLTSFEPMFELDQGSATYIVDFKFGDSGTKLYVLDTSQGLYQYTLSTAYDITTASYASKSLTINNNAYVQGSTILFSGNGSELLVARTDGIDRYELSTAWDLSTATLDAKYTPTGWASGSRCAFSSNGDKLFIVGNTYKDTLYTYPLSTNWDISTTGTATLLEAPFRMPFIFEMCDSGGTLLTGTSSYSLTYELPTPNNFSSCGFNGRLFHNRGSQGGFYTCIEFNSDGTAFYTFFRGAIYKYTLSTAYDLSTMSLDSTSSHSYPNSGYTGVIASVAKDETHVLIATDYNDTIYHYKMTTAGDVSTLTSEGNYTFNNCRYARFSEDGSYFYVVIGDFNVYAYALSTAFDISTKSATSANLGNSGSLTRFFSLENEDTKLTMTSYADFKARQLTGSDATWSINANLVYTIGADTQPRYDNDKTWGHGWNGDGTKFFQNYFYTFSYGVSGHRTCVVYDVIQ